MFFSQATFEVVLFVFLGFCLFGFLFVFWRVFLGFVWFLFQFSYYNVY